MLSGFVSPAKVGYESVDSKMQQIPPTQTKSTTQIAAYIKANFSSEPDRVRAAFIWVASTLAYDVDNMFAVKFNQADSDKIAQALTTRKGICENYALLFCEICQKSGLDAHAVAGYVKHPDFAGFVAHAWCAVKVDGKWQLFDPTWGSGYVENSKFVRKINNDFYMTAPATLLRTHMPYDPMWQLQYHPISYKAFAGAAAASHTTGANFSFPDSIARYEKQSRVQQYETEAGRIERGGVNNSNLHERLFNLKNYVDVYYQNEKVKEQNAVVEKHNAAVAVYNNAVETFNEAVNELNSFIDYRNKEFLPQKSDEAIAAMVDAVEVKLKRVATQLDKVKGMSPKIDELSKKMSVSMVDAQRVTADQKAFLNKYFSKGKLGRKMMFRKYTWMGIPLN